MSNPFEPSGTTPPTESGANYPPYGTPPTSYPPYPPASPYPGAPQPGGYPAQPQGYPSQDYPYPYGAYPPPYGPPGYPPQLPPRKRNTTLWVLLSIGGVVLIGLCVGCGVLVFAAGGFVSSVSKYVQPIAVVETFCQDEIAADYTGAYDQLSPTLQASMTNDQFVAQSTARDTSEGTVSTCDVNISSGTSVSSTSATIGVTMTRSVVGDFAGSMTLISNQSVWTIDTIDPALPILTGGTPTQQATETPTE